jgi:hypothetical protein
MRVWLEWEGRGEECIQNLLGKPARISENRIKMDRGEIGCEEWSWM